MNKVGEGIMAKQITITLPDGTKKVFDSGITALEVVKTIGERLAMASIVAEVDGELIDLSRKITKDCSFKVHTFKSDEGKNIFWHSTSHLLAHAVSRLYKSAKLTIGPAIEQGFYYDIANSPFHPEDLEIITVPAADASTALPRGAAKSIPLYP